MVVTPFWKLLLTSVGREVRDAAKHPVTYRTVPLQPRIISPNDTLVVRLRNPDLSKTRLAES